MDEREFELINIIGPQIAINQRDLSKQMDLSLGNINMLLKRLISKGLIRIKQLDKKKVQYILTPKGFAEKMKKSVNYTLKTVNSISLINKTLKGILTDLFLSECKVIYIIGNSDFSFLVEENLRSIYKDIKEVIHLGDVPVENVEGKILICNEDFNYKNNINKDNCVNVIEELASHENFLRGIVG